jgi:hypothetical protein
MPPLREESQDSAGDTVESSRGAEEFGVAGRVSNELHVRKRRTASGTLHVRPEIARS